MQGMKQEMSELMEFDIDVLQKDYLDNGHYVYIAVGSIIILIYILHIYKMRQMSQGYYNHSYIYSTNFNWLFRNSTNRNYKQC